MNPPIEEFFLSGNPVHALIRTRDRRFIAAINSLDHQSSSYRDRTERPTLVVVVVVIFSNRTCKIGRIHERTSTCVRLRCVGDS